ncbi:MAG: NUDIX hydrolase [Patescibacteria group bacterium]|jgi:8-oxo-dGTP pyrophosphatase MutT (NUDIX family)
MIYLAEPEKFNQEFEVASCFIEHDGEILVLCRANHKPQGGTWGVPAGKIEENELPDETVLRELKEETGILLGKNDLRYFKTLFVRYPTYDFKYHMYSVRLSVKQAVKIDEKSHVEHRWVTPAEALKLNLIQDEDSCIKMFYNLE